MAASAPDKLLGIGDCLDEGGGIYMLKDSSEEVADDWTLPKPLPQKITFTVQPPESVPDIDGPTMCGPEAAVANLNNRVEGAGTITADIWAKQSSSGGNPPVTPPDGGDVIPGTGNWEKDRSHAVVTCPEGAIIGSAPVVIKRCWRLDLEVGKNYDYPVEWRRVLLKSWDPTKKEVRPHDPDTRYVTGVPIGFFRLGWSAGAYHPLPILDQWDESAGLFDGHAFYEHISAGAFEGLHGENNPLETISGSASLDPVGLLKTQTVLINGDRVPVDVQAGSQALQDWLDGDETLTDVNDPTTGNPIPFPVAGPPLVAATPAAVNTEHTIHFNAAGWHVGTCVRTIRIVIKRVDANGDEVEPGDPGEDKSFVRMHYTSISPDADTEKPGMSVPPGGADDIWNPNSD